MPDVFDFIFVALAACAAGFINAVAGGGTLITFPVLIAIGLPAVVANVTNTIALCPGYVGAFFARIKDLRGKRKLFMVLVPVGILGGITGGYLLLTTEEKLFRSLVPFLILIASFLLAIQDIIKGWLTNLNRKSRKISIIVAVPLFFAAIYGGYFGAGLGVILLAVLGMLLEDSLTQVNTLKQVLSFVINVSAAIFFLFSGKVNWPVACVMFVGAVIGGMLGGKFAGSIKPVILRWIVVVIGVIVACIYFIK